MSTEFAVSWKSLALNAGVSALASLVAVFAAALIAIDGLEFQEVRKAQIDAFKDIYAGRAAIFSDCQTTPEEEDRAYRALNSVLGLYADSERVTSAYRRYWQKVRDDGDAPEAQQAFLDLLRAMGEHIEIDTSGISDLDLRRTLNPRGFGTPGSPGPRSPAHCRMG